jgi:hypothetical protein
VQGYGSEFPTYRHGTWSCVLGHCVSTSSSVGAQKKSVQSSPYPSSTSFSYLNIERRHTDGPARPVLRSNVLRRVGTSAPGISLVASSSQTVAKTCSIMTSGVFGLATEPQTRSTDLPLHRKLCQRPFCSLRRHVQARGREESQSDAFEALIEAMEAAS